jgi:DNA-binding IclR family transcriptional regulator
MALSDNKKRKKSTGGSNGVQSAETLLEVLSAFVGTEQSPMLKTLAERCGMHPAKVHRYLVSLCRMGYVEQSEETSRYRLGPATMRFAYAAIGMIDVVRIAAPMMPAFARRLQNTVVFAVWSPGGPTITMIETVPGILTMTARPGTILPIIRSSTGRVFGTWEPRSRVEALIERELDAAKKEPVPGVPKSWTEVEELFVETRRRGLARATGQLSPMAHSFAAPVWDAKGELAAALSVLGPVGQFNSSWNSPLAHELLSCAKEISQALGYLPERLS